MPLISNIIIDVYFTMSLPRSCDHNHPYLSIFNEHDECICHIDIVHDQKIYFSMTTDENYRLEVWNEGLSKCISSYH